MVPTKNIATPVNMPVNGIPMGYETELDGDLSSLVGPLWEPRGFGTKKPWWMARRTRVLPVPIYQKIKRLLDISLVLLSAPVTFPAFLLTATLIKLESPGGSVFFKQYRTGKDGKRFPMYKFRTMVPNAEELKKELAHLNELQWPDFKITNDPRITKMGKFLRKTSLDELPQLINVLKGNMSLVGPRPTSFAASTYSLWHTERLDIVPGLTGLWQIMGRGTMEFDDRVRLDVAYIENRSILLDIWIMIQTVLAVFQKKGA